MTFDIGETYFDSIGREWSVNDKVGNILLVIHIEYDDDKPKEVTIHHALAVVDDENHATIRLDNGFTTLSAIYGKIDVRRYRDHFRGVRLGSE